jgi:hypothetical protein
MGRPQRPRDEAQPTALERSLLAATAATSDGPGGGPNKQRLYRSLLAVTAAPPGPSRRRQGAPSQPRVRPDLLV